MFKKGQLVRHILHDWVLVVAQDEVQGRYVRLCSPIRSVPFKVPAKLLKLIGNNYQPRLPKTKE